MGLVQIMKTVVVRYRVRGETESWREIKLSVDANESIADRISRFEDENFGTVEVAPNDPVVRLVPPRRS
jgi:hypothetical protein